MDFEERPKKLSLIIKTGFILFFLIVTISAGASLTFTLRNQTQIDFSKMPAIATSKNISEIEGNSTPLLLTPLVAPDFSQFSLTFDLSQVLDVSLFDDRLRFGNEGGEDSLDSSSEARPVDEKSDDNAFEGFGSTSMQQNPAFGFAVPTIAQIAFTAPPPAQVPEPPGWLVLPACSALVLLKKLRNFGRRMGS